MNTLGIRKVEPLDDAYLPTAPSILAACFEMLVSNKVQTRDEIERAINLNPEDIENLGGTSEGWLSADKILTFKPRPSMRA